MVDEFQDTDPTQWELILKLSQNEDPTKNSNLFLVGDTKQSIYSFRGSDPRIFQEGLRYIQENAGKIISLADNFRTQKPVLDILNPFFENLFSHNYTPLIPYRTETTGTVTTYIPKEETEATHIANWIEEKLKTHPEFHPHDIAILSRTKTQMDTLQYTLTQKGLKSNILSKPSYYQREEIIVLFNLIKGLLNPEDNLAWKRILIDPLFFHIPENIIAEIYPNHPTLSLLEKCALSNDPVLLSALTEIKKWTSILPLYPLHHVINLILTESNFWYKLASQDNGPKKIQNINMLITKITEYENDAIISSLDILDLIQNAIESNAIESENEAAFKNDHIAILSIHAAKGLEFPIVIISECGKTFNLSKSTPHVLRPLQPTDETAIIEEEKRIFYVACTRAKDHLHLVGKQKETQKNAPSYLKFLTELLPNKNQTSAQLKIS
jgi:ATP-dependent exoDNAse (exonuclease V) beta subunit